MRTIDRLRAATVGAVAIVCATVTTAHSEDYSYSADEWPLAFTKRPLLLAPKMLEIRGDTVRVGLDAGALADPVSLAPDVFYGISRRITLGVNHNRGICLTGESDQTEGCPSAYDDLSLDVLLGILHSGSVRFAGLLGVEAASFDPVTVGFNAGFVARVNVGRVAVLLSPRMYLGVLSRDNKAETLIVPVQLQFQLNPQTAIFALSALRSPLDGFTDENKIPLGAGAVFAINNRMDLGVELTFRNLLGPGGSIDQRTAIVRGALRI